MNEAFRKFANKVAEMTGSAWTFIVALCVIIIWAISGPIFKFSDTWQLIINTSTTIITFLMVFLIQNTQNRDAKAMHIKLDELLRAQSKARNSLVDVEDMEDKDLKKLQGEFQKIHGRYAKELEVKTSGRKKK